MLGNFSDQSGHVLLHVFVGVLEACQHSGENLGFDHHLSQVDRVLRDLTQSAEDLSLQKNIT